MDKYAYYADIFKNHLKPLAFVDMAALDKNIQRIQARCGDKKIRIATKSIRSLAIIRYITHHLKGVSGLMCYSPEEAVWLVQNGFPDVLMGYPTIHKPSIEGICRSNKGGHGTIAFMVDHVDQLQAIQDVSKAEDVVSHICIDVDMSVQFPGVYFGVWRSSLKSLQQIQNLVNTAQQMSHIKILGLMGYESQIAGVGDHIKGKWALSQLVRLLKNLSRKTIETKRAEAVSWIQTQGISLQFVNAGGTGSLEWNKEEAAVSEVTVGSGFFASHLFDHYQNFKHQPAAFFALDITRNPQNNIYTCSYGGYVASGSAGPEKLPQPYLPEGITLIANEGTGEVQTPFEYSGKTPIKIGDPVFFRHSKAGELCERFNELNLISNGQIVDVVKTYRGEGKCWG